MVGAAVLVARDPIGEWRDDRATVVVLVVGSSSSGAAWGWAHRRDTGPGGWEEGRATPRARREPDTEPLVAIAGPAANIRDFARDAVKAGRTVSPGKLALATAFGGANWLTACLLRRLGARLRGAGRLRHARDDLPRSADHPPGAADTRGVGLIETGLLAGLASAGAGAAAAAATVLTYRVLSNGSSCRSAAWPVRTAPTRDVAAFDDSAAARLR